MRFVGFRWLLGLWVFLVFSLFLGFKVFGV